MSSAKSKKESEDWIEPFPNNGCLCRFTIVPQAVKEGLLSGLALFGVQTFIEDGGQAWGNESQDWFGDGCVTTLRDISLALLKQSYELATTRYDEPAWAFRSLRLLLLSVTMVSSSEMAQQILIEIMMEDERARTRTIVMDPEMALLFQLQASCSGEALVKTVIMDLRSLLHHKEHALAHCIIEGFTKWDRFLGGCGESITDSLELLYLTMENAMARDDYAFAECIFQSPKFKRTMDASVELDELTLSRRRLQSSAARMYEAMGNLETAQALYLECGYVDKAEEIKRVISERRPFWAHKTICSFPSNFEADTIFGAREMQEGSVAIFVSSRVNLNRHTAFYILSQGGTLSRQPLPFGGKLWKAIKVLPNAPNERLILLVAPQRQNENFFMSSLSDLGGFGTEELPLAQVWEYDGDVTWREIRCRGDIPDRRAADALGSACAKLGEDRIVVFGGMTPFQGYNQNGMGRSGVFILCLETKEWLQVDHPYELTLASEGRAVGPPIKSLPSFDAVSAYQREDGNPMVMILRKGKSILNEKMGNELVPKYAVDVFVEAQGSPEATNSRRKQCWWMSDVPTYDRSGYVAPTMGVKAVSVAETLLVIGTTRHERIERLRSGEAQGILVDFDTPSGSRVSVDALDFETMEWRGLDIYNDWLLGADLEGSDVLLSNDGESCHLIAIDGGRLRLLTLRNAKSIKASMRDRVSEKKVGSKKNTLSYLLEKSHKTRVEPLHSCSACGKFEAPGVPLFQCCSRCRVTFYCSRECQMWHWKVKGGNHKAKCKPHAEE